jgi:hypothetical protein
MTTAGIEIIAEKQEEIATNSNMNSVLWLMEKTQAPDAKILPAGTIT